MTALVLPTVMSQWMPVNKGKVRRLRSCMHVSIQMCTLARWAVKVHALLLANHSSNDRFFANMIYQ